MGYLIKNGLAVLEGGERVCDIRISGEKIAELGEDLCPGTDAVIDAAGCTVFPGYIDPHTHFDLDFGWTRTADDFTTGTRAAVIGGTTCVIDFATQDKGDTLDAALKAWHGMADGKCYCDYAFHMAVTDWNERTFLEMADMDGRGVTSYKLYMAYDNLRVDDGGMYLMLKRAAALSAITGVHCENGDILKARAAELVKADCTQPKYHPLARPACVEAEAVGRLGVLSRLTGAKVTVVHLSSREGLEAARKARAEGANMVLETCPQYLLLDDSLYEGTSGDPFDGAKVVMSPPLRKRADQDALWEAVSSGEIDTIATDHCSFNYRGQKDRGRGDFRDIPNGGPGVEHRPALMYTYGVKTGRISVLRMAELLSANVARQYGLYPQKGVLAVGSDADIVVWQDKPWKISAEGQRQNCDYTPYEGWEMAGGAKTVLLRGEIAVFDGSLVGGKNGKYIYRRASL